MAKAATLSYDKAFAFHREQLRGGAYPFGEHVDRFIQNAIATGALITKKGKRQCFDKLDFERWSQSEIERLDALYDPENLEDWNLAMAAEWMQSRNMYAVRGRWPEYRTARLGTDAKDASQHGTIFSLLAPASYGELLQAIKGGVVTLYGRSAKTGEFEAVEKDIAESEEINGDRHFQPFLGKDSDNPLFTRLKVKRAEMIGKYPPRQDAPRATEPVVEDSAANDDATKPKKQWNLTPNDRRLLKAFAEKFPTGELPDDKSRQEIQNEVIKAMGPPPVHPRTVKRYLNNVEKGLKPHWTNGH